MANNDKVDYSLRLVDEVSKPSQDAEKALKGVKKELSDVEKAEKKAEEAHKAHADGMKRVGDASQKANTDLLSFASGGVVTAAAALGAVVAGLLVAGEKWAIEASEFQKHTLAALDVIDGTHVSAKATLDSLRTAANSAGLPTEQVTKFYQELRLAGFEIEQVQDIVAAGLDVSAVLGADKGNALVEAMKDIRAKGKLDVGALDQLKGAGLGDSDEFYQVLAGMQGSAAFGKTKKEIEKLLADGKVDADTGTKAILEIVSDKLDKGGPLGSIAKEIGGNSVGGQLQAVKNQLNAVFADSAVTQPFVDALKTINKLLDPTTESGQKIRETLGRAFQGVADWIAKIKPEDIEKFLNTTIKLVDAVLDLGAAFKNGLMKGLEPALKPLRQLTGDSEGASIALEAIGAAVDWLAEFVGNAIGNLISTFLLFPRMIGSVAETISDVWDAIPKSWDELVAWFDSIDLKEIGENIVNGLWTGITDTWARMIEAIEGLLDLLPDAAKKALGIASPSKIFAEIGEYTGEGFVVGVEAQNENAQAAIEDLVEPPDAPSIAFGTPAVGGAAAAATGRGGVTIENLSISLQVSGGDVSDAAAQRFAREFAREFQRTLEGLGDETGSIVPDAEAA